MTTIALHIPRVRCVDETGGRWAEKIGNDEIYLGAVFISISANKSFTVTTTGAKLVNNDFDDKETVNWNRDLFNYNLGDPAVYPYPKVVLASLMLAEHDNGNGRNKFLETLAQDLRAKLTSEAIEAAVNQQRRVTTSPGSAVAAAAPSFVMEALKELAKEKLKEAVDYLIKTASRWAGDDIFPTATRIIDIPTENHTWNGQRQTSEEQVEFVGNKGKYSVSMRWELR